MLLQTGKRGSEGTGERMEGAQRDNQGGRREEKAPKPKGQVRDESAEGGAVNKRGD